MTREEAIRCLSVHSSTNGSGLCTDKQHYEAKQMAIKALEQEPCEDAISRQAVHDAVYRASGLAGAMRAIDNLPTVTPKQRTGHWEWVQYDYNPKLGNWHCSECRCIVVECANKEEKGGIPLYKYCPQCGTKMIEPQESEEQI